MPGIKLIVGLGNPGRDYEHTRHNIGFETLDLLAEKQKAGWRKWSGCASVASPGEWQPLLLAKPQQCMNNSGEAVRRLMDYYHIGSRDILVVLDDFSLPLGTIRLRLSGSSGGHNGLASIIEHIHASDFPRLRLGIGPVPPGSDPADFVLSRFTRAEDAAVAEMTAEAVRVIECAISDGLEKAASRISSAKTHNREK